MSAAYVVVVSANTFLTQYSWKGMQGKDRYSMVRYVVVVEQLYYLYSRK